MIVKQSVFELEMINCRMSIKLPKIRIDFYIHLKNSLAKFRFENTFFEQISFDSIHYAGLASYVFDNCTFMHAFHFDIQRFVDFNILGSSIFVPNYCKGIKCNVHLTGVDDDNLMSDTELSKMYFIRNETDIQTEIKFVFISFNTNIKIVETFSIIDIESSSFQVGQGPFFTVCQASLTLSETVFHIQSHRTRPENLIDIQHYFTLKDVLINLTSNDRDLQQVNIMSLLPGPLAKPVECQNTQIICPLGMDAVETVPIIYNEPSLFQCEAACTSDMYTFQSGNMTLDGHYNYHDVSMKSLVSNLENPHCNQCPVGAKCSGNIKALPNYWGYKDNDTVVMIRCPTG